MKYINKAKVANFDIEAYGSWEMTCVVDPGQLRPIAVTNVAYYNTLIGLLQYSNDQVV